MFNDVCKDTPVPLGRGYEVPRYVLASDLFFKNPASVRQLVHYGQIIDRKNF